MLQPQGPFYIENNNHFKTVFILSSIGQAPVKDSVKF